MKQIVKRFNYLYLICMIFYTPAVLQKGFIKVGSRKNNWAPNDFFGARWLLIDQKLVRIHYAYGEK